MMKQHVKSICMGIGYTLVFHALGWTAAVLHVAEYVSPILGFSLFCAVLLALVPVYFFAMDRAEKRWIFRCAAFLTFVLLCGLALFLINRLATDFLDDLAYLLFGYMMILAMAVISLLDALILLVRCVKRQLRDRSV